MSLAEDRLDVQVGEPHMMSGERTCKACCFFPDLPSTSVLSDGLRKERNHAENQRPVVWLAGEGSRGNQPVCFGCKLVAFGPHVGVKQTGKKRQAVTPVLSL